MIKYLIAAPTYQIYVRYLKRHGISPRDARYVVNDGDACGYDVNEVLIVDRDANGHFDISWLMSPGIDSIRRWLQVRYVSFDDPPG